MIDESKAKEQMTRIQNINLLLRESYFNSIIDNTVNCNVPYGGSINDSIGPWPEFILKGTYCKRSNCGLCSPCFYSRYPKLKKNSHEYKQMLQNQISYITNNFDSLVFQNYKERKKRDTTSTSIDEPLRFVLTPTGSFFDNNEFPQEIRIEMLIQLTKLSEYYGINFELHLESHCHDILFYDTELINNKIEVDLLKILHTRVIFGFESVDDYVRNVVYNKQLTLLDFFKATEKVKNLGLTPGAFVFAGLFSLNDIRTINDVSDTIDYLVRKNIFPVVMFQNIQPYTITDVLFRNNQITLLEPLTVATILHKFFQITDNVNQKSYWLVADPIGGPPEPVNHIFQNNIVSRITCKSCTKKIYILLRNLRETKDVLSFNIKFEEISKCNCYKRYIDFLEKLSQDGIDLINKTEEGINKCDKLLLSYLNEKRTELLN
jgi:radical SAM enzyme (TIGR01210 family)